jgi:TolB protein
MVILGLAIVLLALVIVYVWLRVDRSATTMVEISPTSLLAPSFTGIVSASPIITGSPEISVQATTSFQPSSTSAGIEAASEGSIYLAIEEGGYSHLFLYRLNHPFFRLTSGDWQDITPAVSPDGSKLAFASNRDGYWDLYVMDLNNGTLSRLTESPEYDASPTWSPDGQWLAFESYVQDDQDGNLELFIRTLDDSQSLIRLTDQPGADFSPAWSPGGRQIAFISTRSGENEIWLADLDRTNDRFQNLSRNPSSIEAHPAWSPDGGRLSWSSTSLEGIQQIVIWDSKHPEIQPTLLNTGEWSVWNLQGNMVLVTLPTPNHVYLTGYGLEDQDLALPILRLPGPVGGFAWSKVDWGDALPRWMLEIPQVSPTPLWNPVFVSANVPEGRMEVVPLDGIDAPYPMLQDQVDESFHSLRARISAEVGWDLLADLEQAYLPFNSPLGPGMQEDWLYTARAFRFNTSPVNAGWVMVVRQDFGSQVYWRIFLRTLAQDGSQGIPLRDLPWDFNARYSGDPLAYERGGSITGTIPPGYWLDFTRLALAYGWERLPALNSWIIAFSSARFNEFVLRNGLDWFSAMLQIYPREALNTPTIVSSPTPTSTASDTPTITATFTRTPYMSRTPSNTPTPWPTKTLKPSKTPWPTITLPP